MNTRRKIFLVLTVCWMILIFWFSSRTAELSEKDSLRVGRFAAELLVPGFEEWPFEKQDNCVRVIDHAVRKTAHFTEYLVLGILLTGFFTDADKRPGIWIRNAWLSGTIYAASDEFHQLFVAGRSGQFTDVMLDSAGVLTGVLLAILWIWLLPVWRTVLYRIGFGG